MTTDFWILTIMITVHTIGAPIYIHSRERMIEKTVKETRPREFYTKIRILKLTAIIALLFILAIIGFLSLFLSIKSRSNLNYFSSSDLILSSSFILITFFIAFGGGIYITAIVQEQYLLKPMKKAKEYKVLRLVNDVYHGPVSHAFIYSGAFCLLVLTAILERNYLTKTSSTITLTLYAFYGVCFGLVYLWSRIKDTTWKVQTPILVLIYIIYLLFIFSSNFKLSNAPFNIFLLIGGSILTVGLIIKSLNDYKRSQY